MAAGMALEKRNYQLALDLYSLSAVPASVLVCRLLRAGQTGILMQLLTDSIMRSHELTAPQGRWNLIRAADLSPCASPRVSMGANDRRSVTDSIFRGHDDDEDRPRPAFHYNFSRGQKQAAANLLFLVYIEQMRLEQEGSFDAFEFFPSFQPDLNEPTWRQPDWTDQTDGVGSDASRTRASRLLSAHLSPRSERYKHRMGSLTLVQRQVRQFIGRGGGQGAGKRQTGNEEGGEAEDEWRFGVGWEWRGNHEYTTAKAMEAVLSFFVTDRGVAFMLRVGHSRGEMEQCLRIMAKQGGYHLTHEHVGFLLARGYAPMFLNTPAGGHLLRALPPWQQLEIILMDMVPAPPRGGESGNGKADDTSAARHPAPVNLSEQNLEVLFRILPSLDHPCLLRLVSFADPSSTGPVWRLLTLAAGAGGQADGADLCIELFLSALLRLVWMEDAEDRGEAIPQSPQAPQASQTSSAESVLEQAHVRALAGTSEGQAKKPREATGNDSQNSHPATDCKEGKEADADSQQTVGGDNEINADGGWRLRSQSERTQHRLLIALRQYWGRYRLSLLLPRSVDMRNWKAAALLHVLAGEWAQALQCQLLAAEQRQRRQQRRQQQQQHQVVHQVSEHVHDNVTSDEATVRVAPEPSGIQEGVEQCVPAADVLQYTRSHLPNVTGLQQQVQLLRQLLLHFARWHRGVWHQLEATLQPQLDNLYEAFCCIIWHPNSKGFLFQLAATQESSHSQPQSQAPSPLQPSPSQSPQPPQLPPEDQAHLQPLEYSAHQVNVHPPDRPHHINIPGVPFSAAFLLSIVQHKLLAMEITPEQGDSKTMSRRAPVRRLWLEILRNLDQGLQRSRENIVLTSASLNPVSAVHGNQEQQEATKGKVRGKRTDDSQANARHDVIAFTCGHVYKRDQFHQDVLPEFMYRMSRLQPATPTTAKLLHTEYHQKVIALTCPLCLYNGLLQEQKHAHTKRGKATTDGEAMPWS